MAVTKEKRSEYNRRFRDANPGYLKKYRDRWKERYPEKRRAQKAVWAAVLAGRIKRRPCEDCGSTDRIEGHHDDYDKPLDVRWFCLSHHRAIHSEKR